MRHKLLVALLLFTAVLIAGCTEVTDSGTPSFSGLQNITYTIGDPMPNYLLNVTASDNIDGNLTAMITVDDAAVDYETPGSYPVIYHVSDLSGNEEQVTVYIQVNALSTDVNFEIYYLNDFHGAILPDDNALGFASIANLIMTKKAEAPEETLFMTGGDMLQGALLSNYYNGASVIDMLNMMSLDAFVLGNHEFDWGLDVVLDYFDPMSDAPVHANFPLLAANLIETSTGERPDFVDPYTIIQKQGVKIGIIGTIGYGLESSIAASRVAGYEFLDPVEWTSFYATYLRTVEDVDVVMAVSHGDSDYFNSSVASFTGDAKVDAIYNGHSHQNYVEQKVRDGVDAYVMQSGANGSAVGYASLDLTDGILTGWQAQNLNQYNETLLNGTNSDMQDLIDDYMSEVEDLIQTNIITAGTYISRSSLTVYMAKIMRVKTESDIAFHNYGGTRTDVYEDQAMTVGLAYEIFPFDNVIKTTELLGSTIKDLMNWTSIGYDTEILNFEDNTYYKVATNDYVYDGNPDTFDAGMNPENTYLLLRDLFIEVLEDLRDAGHTEFYVNLDIPDPLSMTMSTEIIKPKVQTLINA